MGEEADKSIVVVGTDRLLLAVVALAAAEVASVVVASAEVDLVDLAVVASVGEVPEEAGDA